MTIPTEHQNRYFYHFTHIENLDSILKNGLICTNQKEKIKIAHMNIACMGIQERRSSMDVTCNPQGKVHDYVPFYFTARSPMLLSVIKSKNVDQQKIIYFAIPIQKLLEENVVFTNSSANTGCSPNFYNTPNLLSSLDWGLIDSPNWNFPDENERHKKMAEVLIFNKVPLDWISNIIVWNNNFKERVIEIYNKNKYNAPKFEINKFCSKYFFFNKFMFGKPEESLITGPDFLIYKMANMLKEVDENRKKTTSTQYLFDSLNDMILRIDADFSVLPELDEINGLKTSNPTHNKTVSEHTNEVVRCIKEQDFYHSCTPIDKNILAAAAYLHDIGKGPKSKWKDNNGIQKTCSDHPADAIPMLKRIFTECVKNISEDEINTISVLVVYHDLVGDILFNNRDESQIIKLITNEKGLDMLIAINLADVSAISEDWAENLKNELPDFRSNILKEINV